MIIEGHGVTVEIEPDGRAYISDGQGEGPATDRDGLRWLAFVAIPALLAGTPEGEEVKVVEAKDPEQIPGQLAIG